MDALSALFDELKKKGQAHGNFLGLLHGLIARKITRKADSVLISNGMTWRDVATALKKHRWDPEAVRELGINPDDLPPRDRQRFWYTAISQAKIDSPAARAAGDRFVEELKSLGYEVD